MSFQRFMLLVAVWIIIGWWMSFTPISDETVPYTMLGVSVLFIILVAYVRKQYWWKQLLWIGAVWVFGILIEYIGITTCFPYGCFRYSSYVWPQFLGTFPWLLVMIRPILVVTITQRTVGWKQPLLYAFSWWVLLMMVDLFLDPVAVHQWLRSYHNLVWQWLQPRYNVPRSNFLWWILTWTLSTFIFRALSPLLLWDKYLRYTGLVIMTMYVSAFFFLFG